METEQGVALTTHYQVQLRVNHLRRQSPNTITNFKTKWDLLLVLGQRLCLLRPRFLVRELWCDIQSFFFFFCSQPTVLKDQSAARGLTRYRKHGKLLAVWYFTAGAQHSLLLDQLWQNISLARCCLLQDSWDRVGKFFHCPNRDLYSPGFLTCMTNYSFSSVVIGASFSHAWPGEESLHINHWLRCYFR